MNEEVESEISNLAFTGKGVQIKRWNRDLKPTSYSGLGNMQKLLLDALFYAPKLCFSE